MLESDIIRKIEFLEILNNLKKLPGIYIKEKNDQIIGIYYVKSGFYKNKIFVFRYTNDLFIYPKVIVKGNNLLEKLKYVIEIVENEKCKYLYKKLKIFKKTIFECIKANNIVPK
ncbi:hypothetical protein DMUE_2728 [Dictyocoela muelleri]|nr:hypothetical protein DMUE_2728 [Dictyocoela muelleri]